MNKKDNIEINIEDEEPEFDADLVDSLPPTDY